MRYETKRTLTKYLIGFIVVLVVLLVSSYYLSISYNLDYNISFLIVLFMFAIVAFVILYAFYGPRTRYREPYYKNRVDVYHHHIDEGSRYPPRTESVLHPTRHLGDTERNINRYMGRVNRQLNKIDIVDNWGFLKKGKRRR